MIQELHAGDRQIPASGWNEIRAAIQGMAPGQQQYQSGKFNPVYITIKNVTGSDLPAFSVVKIDGATYNLRTGDTFIDAATKNGVELNGYAPTAANDKIAITQAACPDGGLVKALVSGATACYINGYTAINNRYATISAYHTDYLDGTDTVTGIQVLWIAPGSGKREAVVRLGTYNPQTVLNVTVDGTTGGGNPVYTTIDGVQWEVIFPNSNAGLSATNYPDIYPYDQILVLLDVEAGLCYALDYPTDYEGGSIQAFYQQPGRGWDSSAVTTPQALADVGLTLYYKDKTGAIL